MNHDGLWFGYIPIGQSEFVTLALITVKDLQMSLSLERPPINAEFLLFLFLSAKNCDAFVGDLEERYRLIRRKFGRRRADFWYWKQVIWSVAPIVWAWGKKILKKPTRRLWQREHNQRIGSHDRDILLAIFTLICHRIRIRAPIEFSHPQLLAGFRVNRAEAIVVRRPHE